MKSQTRTLRGTRGRTIVYDVHEPDGDAVGVVFLVHGLGEHAGRYTAVVRRLTDAGYLVVAPDHAGHGRSTGTPRDVHDFSDFTDDLGRVISAVGTGGLPVFLLGHSMGGAIALSYTLDHQDQVDGLVLSGPALVPGEDMPPLLVVAAPIVGRLLPRMPSADLSAAALSRDPEVVAAYEADPLVWHGKIPAGLGGALVAEMNTFPDRLPSLRIPVLALHGGDDALANPAGSRSVDELAGGDDVTVRIYPGLYHEIFNEPEGDQIVGEVVDWLQAHTR